MNYQRFKLNELKEEDISKRLKKLSGDWYRLFIYLPKKITGSGKNNTEVDKNFLEEIKVTQINQGYFERT